MKVDLGGEVLWKEEKFLERALYFAVLKKYKK